MTATIFNRADDWQKQKDIVLFAISRLKQLRQLEVTCVDYASACAFSRLVQRFDTEKEVREVHIFSYFVRMVQNERGAFRFSCSVIDHHGAKFTDTIGPKPPVK